MKGVCLLAAVVLFASGPSYAQGTDAEEKQACFRAVDEGQRLHIEHKLVSARQRFAQCARPVCPTLFRDDCAGWLTEVQAALPSVVFGAKDARGQDLSDVRVLVDGQPIAARLEGTSTEVDPGPHVFRFEWEGHGAVEQKAVIREGEKDRLITAAFGASPIGGDSSRSGGRSAQVPTGVWVLGGVAVAGAAGFLALFFATESNVRDMRASCAPGCPSSRVDAAMATYALGYASLGVGIAAAGVATGWLTLSRSKRGTITLAPSPGGGAVGWSRTF